MRSVAPSEDTAKHLPSCAVECFPISGDLGGLDFVSEKSVQTVSLPCLWSSVLPCTSERYEQLYSNTIPSPLFSSHMHAHIHMFDILDRHE
jgi:hypothetical protein